MAARSGFLRDITSTPKGTTLEDPSQAGKRPSFRLQWPQCRRGSSGAACLLWLYISDGHLRAYPSGHVRTSSRGRSIAVLKPTLAAATSAAAPHLPQRSPQPAVPANFRYRSQHHSRWCRVKTLGFRQCYWQIDCCGVMPPDKPCQKPRSGILMLAKDCCQKAAP